MDKNYIDREMTRLTSEIARLFKLDPRLYKVNISFVMKDIQQRPQEMRR